MSNDLVKHTLLVGIAEDADGECVVCLHVDGVDVLLRPDTALALAESLVMWTENTLTPGEDEDEADFDGDEWTPACDQCGPGDETGCDHDESYEEAFKAGYTAGRADAKYTTGN